MDEVRVQEAIQNIEKTETKNTQSYDKQQHLSEEFRLELNSQNNRHAENILEKKVGKIGILIGTEPDSIATFALLSGFVMIILFCIIIILTPQNYEIWSKQIERVLSFMGAAIAYVFGRSSAKSN